MRSLRRMNCLRISRLVVMRSSKMLSIWYHWHSVSRYLLIAKSKASSLRWSHLKKFSDSWKSSRIAAIPIRSLLTQLKMPSLSQKHLRLMNKWWLTQSHFWSQRRDKIRVTGILSQMLKEMEAQGSKSSRPAQVVLSCPCVTSLVKMYGSLSRLASIGARASMWSTVYPSSKGLSRSTAVAGKWHQWVPETPRSTTSLSLSNLKL